MAAPQWSGGKCKSVQAAKAYCRHNDKDRRQEMKHANPHIDKAMTKYNFSYRGLSYGQLCEAFDDRMASVEVGRQSSGKNARVVMQSVIIYPPAALVDDKDKLRSWFMDAGKVLEQQFGNNFLDMQVDFDENHEYIDASTKEKRMSREHGHARLFPEVDGKLNCKAFSSRKVINTLNSALQEMSLDLYGVPMMDGTKRKGGSKVEDLKARSEAEEIKQRALEDAQKAADAVVRRTRGKMAGELRKASEALQTLNEAIDGYNAAAEALDDASSDLDDIACTYKQAMKDKEADTPRKEFLSSFRMKYKGQSMTGEEAFLLWQSERDRKREEERQRQIAEAKAKAKAGTYQRDSSEFDRIIANMRAAQADSGYDYGF